MNLKKISPILWRLCCAWAEHTPAPWGIYKRNSSPVIGFCGSPLSFCGGNYLSVAIWAHDSTLPFFSDRIIRAAFAEWNNDERLKIRRKGRHSVRNFALDCHSDFTGSGFCPDVYFTKRLALFCSDAHCIWDTYVFPFGEQCVRSLPPYEMPRRAKTGIFSTFRTSPNTIAAANTKATTAGDSGAMAIP